MQSEEVSSSLRQLDGVLPLEKEKAERTRKGKELDSAVDSNPCPTDRQSHTLLSCQLELLVRSRCDAPVVCNSTGSSSVHVTTGK